MSIHTNILKKLANQSNLADLLRIKTGIEKEGLRIDAEGNLSQRPHPESLGAALTHPYITTDYSEAMLEFITEPFEGVEPMMNQLEEIHRFCYQNIGDERIWAASMPCMIKEDSEVPIATYGTSNVGRMKYIYRVGLAHRYGRKMQSITGIHYNFSLGDPFWRIYRDGTDPSASLMELKSSSYLSLIRNFIRNSWLVCYLFGASPALCKSFLLGHNNPLQEWDPTTSYLPYATSLRMSNLGYQSDAQNSLYVCYNELNSYIETLQKAVDTEYAPYRKFKRSEKGEYQQLNSNLLQIENEFYSHVRPKQITRSGERPVDALQKRGIEYVEVRLLDINPFLPLGIDREQAYFLNTFLMYCLLAESPQLSTHEFQRIKNNRMQVLFQGRDPKFRLDLENCSLSPGQAGGRILEKMIPVGELLDKASGSDVHMSAIMKQKDKLTDPDRLPSAAILNQIKENNQSYTNLILSLSEKHLIELSQELPDGRKAFFDNLSASSIKKQKQIEEEDDLDFDQYLKNYFS
ncbi:MAG: glutamate--cysteine ligase [Proteobacteria bacterium]|nr:glutamate--cysteine ligase [Pseudomonadota bacterium]